MVPHRSLLIFLAAALAAPARATLHHDALELDPAAAHSDKALRAAYKRRALETHPDRGGTTHAFQAVAEAYACLSDPACAAGEHTARPSATPTRTPGRARWSFTRRPSPKASEPNSDVDVDPFELFSRLFGDDAGGSFTVGRAGGDLQGMNGFVRFELKDDTVGGTLEKPVQGRAGHGGHHQGACVGLGVMDAHGCRTALSRSVACTAATYTETRECYLHDAAAGDFWEDDRLGAFVQRKRF